MENVELLAGELLEAIHAEATAPEAEAAPLSVYKEALAANETYITMLEAKIVALKKIVVDIAGEDYLAHKGF